MDPERYQRLREVFHHASGLALAEREAYLREACAADPSLLDEVQALLAADEQAAEAEYLDSDLFRLDAHTTLLDATRGFTATEAERATSARDDHSLVLDDRYRLGRRLGRGGMGEVFEAVHLALKRPVAVKLILGGWLCDAAAVERFNTEAEALGRLRHPNIVSVTDFGVDDADAGMPYIVTELLEGRALSDVLQESGPMGIDQALPILEGIAAGLGHAHRSGVVHGDLKPANIFLARSGRDGSQVKILDFGLARLVEEGSKAHAVVGARVESEAPANGGSAAASWEPGPLREIVGTPLYMAPELDGGGERDVSTDVYSLAVLAYEMLTGELPFDIIASGIGGARRAGDPTPPSQLVASLPREIDRPLVSALALEPSLRPETPAVFVEKLRAARESARVRRFRERETPRRLALAFALGMLATALGWLAGMTPPLANLEDRIADTLFLLARPRDPDPRIALVLIDDAAVAMDPRTALSERDEEFAGLLGQAFAAGASGVGIDILLHPKWSESAAFAGLVLGNPSRLVLAAFSDNGALEGPQVVMGLPTVALGPAAAARLFGFVNVLEDTDGRVRRMTPAYIDADGRPRASFASRAAEILADSPAPMDLPTGPQRIDYTVDWRRWTQLSWAELPEVLARRPETLHGRFVLVGTRFTGSGDVHSVPHRAGMPEDVPGVVLQALMIDTLLSGASIHELAHGRALLLTLPVVMLLAAAALLRPSTSLASAGAIVAVAAIAGASAGSFLLARLVVPVLVPGLAVVLGAVAALFVRRHLPPHPLAG